MPVIINGTTGIQIPDGTAANPAIRGTTSANTGLFFPAANQVGFSTNSSQKLVTDVDGNVGIGTSTPQTPLDVVSPTSGALGIQVRGRASDNQGYIRFVDNSVLYAYAHIGSPGANSLTFLTNGFNERMRIDSTGNVGIGVTSTTYKLDVAGAVNTSSVLISGRYVSPFGMKNRIINGDFRFDQRFGGLANNNIALGAVYVVDRWAHYGAVAAKLRFQQNNTNGPGSSATQIATGFPNYFGANVVSANTVSAGDAWDIYQAIEGLNIADLGWGTANAQPVTLSFWSYSSTAGLHAASVLNGLQNRSYPFSYTISTANTWQYQSITIPGDTTGSWWSNNNVGIYLIFNLGIGSNFSGTDKTWNAAQRYVVPNVIQPVSLANGAFYVTGVQLERGSANTPFEYRPHTVEFALCQRYYQASTSLGSNNSFTINGGDSVGMCHPTANFRWGMKFPVQMRAAPLMAVYDSIGTAARFSYFTTVWTNGGTLVFGPTPSATGFYIGHNQASSVETQFNYIASAEI